MSKMGRMGDMNGVVADMDGGGGYGIVFEMLGRFRTRG